MENKLDKRVFIGAILLIIGVLLTLDNINVLNIDLPDYVLSWPSFLVVIGLFLVTVRDKVGFGITVMVVGAIFLTDEISDYYFWDFDLRDIFRLWPLILVAIGISLIFKRKELQEAQKKSDYGDMDFVDEMAVFGAAERVIQSQQFKGGKLTSIFGGTDLNLLNAKLDHGKNILDVFVLFGGCDIRVPADMNVKVEVTAIFGAFADERKVAVKNEENNGHELVIKGLVLFGGGEVK